MTKTGDEVVVKASPPDVKKDDLTVTIEDNVLTIEAEIAQEAERSVYRLASLRI